MLGLFFRLWVVYLPSDTKTNSGAIRPSGLVVYKVVHQKCYPIKKYSKVTQTQQIKPIIITPTQKVDTVKITYSNSDQPIKKSFSRNFLIYIIETQNRYQSKVYPGPKIYSAQNWPKPIGDFNPEAA